MATSFFWGKRNHSYLASERHYIARGDCKRGPLRIHGESVNPKDCVQRIIVLRMSFLLRKASDQINVTILELDRCAAHNMHWQRHIIFPFSFDNVVSLTRLCILAQAKRTTTDVNVLSNECETKSSSSVFDRGNKFHLGFFDSVLVAVGSCLCQLMALVQHNISWYDV